VNLENQTGAFIENKGTPQAPWFGDSTPEIQPFGIVLPTSDSIAGLLPINNFHRFADMDGDNDFDLFLGGRFVKQGMVVHDENFYFYRNDAPSGNGTQPHFAAPVKNPFNLPRPLFADASLAPTFVDMDCDGDMDFFAVYAGAGVSYFENTGTPASPNFDKTPVTWLANDPRAPPGFQSYFFGDWLDVGGDGDLDLIMPGTWLENTTGGSMACQAAKVEYVQCLPPARVQFIHAADHETVKLTANGETLREIFAYQTATPFIDLPAGSFVISPTPANNNDNILDPFQAHMGFWQGRSAVIFGTGLVGNHTFQPWVALSNGGTFPLFPPPGQKMKPGTGGENLADGSLRIAPNPASRKVQVLLKVTEAGASALELFNANGERMLEMDLGELPIGYLPVDLDLSELAAGVYFLKYRNGGAVATERLAVMKR
jgi:hypothetical protein